MTYNEKIKCLETDLITAVEIYDSKLKDFLGLNPLNLTPGDIIMYKNNVTQIVDGLSAIRKQFMDSGKEGTDTFVEPTKVSNQYF